MFLKCALNALIQSQHAPSNNQADDKCDDRYNDIGHITGNVSYHDFTDMTRNDMYQKNRVCQRCASG